MCFSAQADIVGGVVVGAVGIDVLRHVHGRHRYLPLATLPLLLGLHQIDEAFVWWGLQGHVSAGVGRVATWTYLLIAFVVLPVLVPAAVLALEPAGRRRQAMVPFVVVGVAVSGVLLAAMIRGPVTATLGHNHLAYSTDLPAGLTVVSAYVVATCGALIMSGYRDIAIFAIVNLVAVAVLAKLTIDGFASLWCGWAAVTSGAFAIHLRYGRAHLDTTRTSPLVPRRQLPDVAVTAPRGEGGGPSPLAACRRVRHPRVMERSGPSRSFGSSSPGDVVAHGRSPVNIEVFADIWCPFTHAGLRAVEQQRQVRARGDVGLIVRSWPLELVNGVPMDPVAVLHHVDELREQVAPDLFQQVDIAHFPTSTLEALALVVRAYRVGIEVGEQASFVLRDALFEHGEDISDRTVLRRIADRLHVGLPDETDRAAVRHDWEDGRRRGVLGSPHFFWGEENVFCPSLTIARNPGSGLRIKRTPDRLVQFLDQCFSGVPVAAPLLGR